MATSKKPKPPIHCRQHDDLTPDRQRACYAQPIPATARDQLGFIIAVALRDATRRKPKADPDALRRDIISTQASLYNVSAFTIRRHLAARGPRPGAKLRRALAYDIEGLFCPVRRAETEARREQERLQDAKARADKAVRAGEALNRQFGDR
ncbi:hypothetical protein [Streptacidiphilus sp. EB129]|uniref:hypothetical protein n=1 Tax=Streptacidiphilus sp. EB129 TaxID=3156262 RepID=UPI003511EA40